MDFSTDEHLPGVESLMGRLVTGAPVDPAGSIAQEHLSTGGKRLRARLALSGCERLGWDAERGIAWATACELLHNATLVHDDIQDGDRVRRGHPTAWVTHGVPQAINAGDLLWVAPYLALGHLDADDAIKWRLSHLLASRAAMIVRGQSVEWRMHEVGDTDRGAYLRAICGKTSALFELPIHGSALLAGKSGRDAEKLAEPFGLVGMLFQMQDDVLDLFGEKGRAEVGADLREGKISALVVEHVARYPDQRDALLRLLQTERDKTPDAEVLATIESFRTGGALESVCKRMRSIAIGAVDSAALAGELELSELLRQLIDVVLRPIEHVMKEYD